MEKIKLSLTEILQLEGELNGYTNPENGEQIYQGFLKQSLPILLKYELSELSESLLNEKKKVDTLRDELIKKYGEDKGNGEVFVRTFDEITDNNGNIVSKKFNENFLKFEDEFLKLLNKEKEIEYPKITKEDIKESGKSKDNYKILFKLIKKD